MRSHLPSTKNMVTRFLLSHLKGSAYESTGAPKHRPMHCSTWCGWDRGCLHLSWRRLIACCSKIQHGRVPSIQGWNIGGESAQLFSFGRARWLLQLSLFYLLTRCSLSWVFWRHLYSSRIVADAPGIVRTPWTLAPKLNMPYQRRRGAYVAVEVWNRRWGAWFSDRGGRWAAVSCTEYPIQPTAQTTDVQAQGGTSKY